ncbi:putative spore protein YtfJ [Mycetocola sp. CAN_C7]|uniref:hypothetical protein n=1 Tax=Mycetocola sp. CAN_C7 TaxID=2787724 RepID=UPI0018C9439F
MTKLALELADKFKAVGVTSVYGDPVDIDGEKLVPVALAWYGFGAGEGEGEGDTSSKTVSGTGSGSGGGGGGFALPIGAYVKGREGLHFEPNLVSLVAVGIPFIWVVGKALSFVIKALKK